jgi:hypothetical protein
MMTAKDRQRLDRSIKCTGQDNWQPRKPLSEMERYRRHGPVKPLDDAKWQRRRAWALLALVILAWLMFGALVVEIAWLFR